MKKKDDRRGKLPEVSQFKFKTLILCVLVFCSEVQLADRHVQCTDSNNLNSVCTFSCAKGFILLGNQESKCQVTGKVALWKPDIPQCPGT